MKSNIQKWKADLHRHQEQEELERVLVMEEHAARSRRGQELQLKNEDMVDMEQGGGGKNFKKDGGEISNGGNDGKKSSHDGHGSSGNGAQQGARQVPQGKPDQGGEDAAVVEDKQFATGSPSSPDDVEIKID